MRFASKYRRYRLTAREHVKMTLANGRENVIQQGIICRFEHGGPFEQWERQQAQAQFKFRGTTMERDEATPVDPLNRLSLFDTDAPWLVKQWAAFEKLEQDEREKQARHQPGLDTKPGWVKREIENFLVNYQANGRDYIQLIPVAVPAPWPSYDELTIHGQRNAAKVAEKNIEIARATGVSFDDVIAYEKQNRNDARIIEAYEAAKAEDLAGEPEPEVVTA